MRWDTELRVATRQLSPGPSRLARNESPRLKASTESSAHAGVSETKTESSLRKPRSEKPGKFRRITREFGELSLRGRDASKDGREVTRDTRVALPDGYAGTTAAWPVDLGAIPEIPGGEGAS